MDGSGFANDTFEFTSSEDDLTPEEIDAARESYASANAMRGAAIGQFYANLFEGYPALKLPYASLAGPPKTMVWATVGLLADNAHDLASLRLPMRQLGARHGKMGVGEDMYGAFADTLVGTIADAHGEGWSEVHERAWEKLLGIAITYMQDGAALDSRARV